MQFFVLRVSDPSNINSLLNRSIQLQRTYFQKSVSHGKNSPLYLLSSLRNLQRALKIIIRRPQEKVANERKV